MTRLIPIVALVTEDTLHALNDAVSAYGPVGDVMQETMNRNGWTIDAIVAGSFIKFCLIDHGVKA